MIDDRNSDPRPTTYGEWWALQEDCDSFRTHIAKLEARNAELEAERDMAKATQIDLGVRIRELERLLVGWDADLPQPWNEESAKKILALVEDRDGLRRDLAEMTKTAELRLMRALQAEQERNTVKRDRDESRDIRGQLEARRKELEGLLIAQDKDALVWQARVRELEAHDAFATAHEVPPSPELADLLRKRYPRLLERGNPMYDGLLADAVRRTEDGGALNQTNNEIDRLRARVAELEKQPRANELRALRNLFAAAGHTIHAASAGGRATLEEINDAWAEVCAAHVANRDLPAPDVAPVPMGELAALREIVRLLDEARQRYDKHPRGAGGQRMPDEIDDLLCRLYEMGAHPADTRPKPRARALPASRVLRDGEERIGAEELAVLREVVRLVAEAREGYDKRPHGAGGQRMPDEIDDLLCRLYEIGAHPALRAQPAEGGA